MRTRRNGVRFALAVLIVFVIVVVFVVRLVDIQLVQAASLNEQSRDKRAQSLVTYAVRGNIVDTNGAVLAASVERYDITASPRSAMQRPDAATAVFAALTRIASITGQDPAVLMATLNKDPTSNFAYLTKGVTLDVFTAVRDLNIPWVYFELRPSRSYPNGQVAGNLVGFMGTDGAQAGVELTGNSCLASTNGSATYERAEDGTPLPGSVVTAKKPVNGGTLRLTIDRDLQWYVQQRMEQTAQELGASWATAVVIRIKDGHLMAVADYPTVDPNNVDLAPRDALGSRSFSTPYEPGSIMKALTAASLIDAGVATPATGVVAPYRLAQPDGSWIKDAFYHDTQNWTLAGALVQSSNTAVSQFSTLLPAQARHDYMIGFGLNNYTEVGFNGEATGTVHPASAWDGRTTYTVQFGQGMTATSVQMASVYQTLGNGGLRMPVTLVEGCQRPDGTVTDLPPTQGRQVVSPSAARQTVTIMEQVANRSGSAPYLQIAGYRTAVKSGTAQVAENGGYASDKVVISYAGVAPADNPQFAVVVTAGVPGNMYSGRIAPTWRDVMAQTLTTFRVQPSTSPAPELPLTW